MRWDIELTPTGNQAKIVTINNGVSVKTFYSDKNVALAEYNNIKNSNEIIMYSDYIGYAIHQGGSYKPEIKGINVFATDIVSYPILIDSTNITTTTFQANWYPLANFRYYIDVSTNSSFSTFVTGFNNFYISNGDSFKVVTGLTTATDYYFRVKSRDAYGNTSIYSLTKKVTTL